MKNPEEVMDRLSNYSRQLSNKNSEYLEYGTKVAEAEKHYTVLFAQEMLKLRDDGMPVTILKDITKGRKSVAEAKFNLAVAEAMYNACRESLKDLRANIDVGRSFLSWLKSEFETSGNQ